MSCVWRSGLRIPLQCADVRGLQRVLPAQRHQECRLLLQVRTRVRNGHVHEAQVSGVPAEEVSCGGHATRVRCARKPMRYEAQGKEGAERKGQSADTSTAARVEYVRL